jgi:hypothetical protein
MLSCPLRALRRLLTVCTGCNLCKPCASYVHVGCGTQLSENPSAIEYVLGPVEPEHSKRFDRIRGATDLDLNVFSGGGRDVAE